MSDHEGRWDEQLKLGRRAFEEGDHEIAETALIRALAEARQLGDDDPRLAGTLDTLGMLYYAQGRFAEAAPILEEALRIFERKLGPDHLTTAATANNLAQVEEEIGRTAAAEAHYQRALEIRERLLGPEDSSVAATLNNLAVLYRRSDRPLDAERIYQRSLELWERSRGGEHPAYGRTLANLAALYQSLGRFEEAESRYARALAIAEAAFGSNHLEVAQVQWGLASVLAARGKPEAESLYHRALLTRVKAHGPESAAVGRSLLGVGAYYAGLRHWREAEPLIRKGASILEQVLGRRSPEVRDAWTALMRLFEALGKTDDAEELRLRMQEISGDDPDEVG